MPVDLFDKILEAARVGETTDGEFKSARGGFPGSFWESYSAMANSEGGVILLGVREKGGDSSHKGGDSSHSNDWEHLETIACNISARKRSSIEAVRDTILSLCLQRYLTAEQIARLLKRNVNSIRNRYLSPMVSDNLLKLRYPETTNRPDQAYITTED
jgi:ATP-dependent DNA helicase RecG